MKASYHMNMKGLAAALFLGAMRLGSAASHDDAFSDDGLIKADAATLKDTRLIAHPALPLNPADNVIWCGTLQLVWNKAIDLVGEKLHFTRPSALADLLDAEDFTAQDLDPGSYVALADFERNHVEEEIRAALQKTFHGEASPELIPTPEPNPRPEDFVAYAYLFKNLAFAQPFSDETTLEFRGTPVKSFGFDGDHSMDDSTRGQVTICDYQSQDDFVIKLATKSANDELILAKVQPGATLAQTIAAVLARTHHAPEDLTDRDRLIVPKLNFDLRRDFGELEGLVLKPSPAAKVKGPLVIAEVKQLVRFQLNEKGAVLKSEAEMMMVGATAGPHFEPPSHQMIFDAPFLILLKQKNAAQPYFATWIGNTSLLMPDKK